MLILRYQELIKCTCITDQNRRMSYEMDRRPVKNETNIALRGINRYTHKITVDKLCRQIRQHRQYREMENNKLMR
jgi:hypothetical protein